MNDIFKNFFLGINYWDSKNAVKMWENYDSSVIESDFAKMKKAKITHLRIFLMWPDFQPLTAFYNTKNVYEWGLSGKTLPDTKAGQAGVSEKMCKNFADFCRLAEKYGFKLIVALLTGHVSFGLFLPPAFYNRNMLTDSTVVKWEIKFVKYFVERFKNEKAIVAWDLGNKVNAVADESFSSDDAYVRMSTIANAIKSVDNSRYVISGMESDEIEKGFNLKSIGDI